MRPFIEASSFGSITINGTTFPHDVYIWANGEIRKRKKKLSKKIYGTSHNISKDEIDFIISEEVEFLLIGTGQYGRAKLSEPALELLAMRNIRAELHPTPEAIQTWNDRDEINLGLFHVTC